MTRFFCLIILFASAAACSDLDSSSTLAADNAGGEGSSGRPGSPDASTADGGGFPDTTGGTPRCRFDQPGLDTDGDGLQDVAEDSNLNCVVDPGETDPSNPDTDGDGLLDGQEDLNRNGVPDLERGEFDPLVADTDGDGQNDGDEPLAALCVDAVAGAALRSSTLMQDGRLLLLAPDVQTVAGADGQDLWMRSGSLVTGYLGPQAGAEWRSSPRQALQALLGPDANIVASGASWGYEDQLRLWIEGDWASLQSAVLAGVGVGGIPDSGMDDGPTGSPMPGGFTEGLVVEVHSIADAMPPRVTLSLYPSGQRPANLDDVAQASRIAPAAESVPGVWCVEAPIGTSEPGSMIVVGDIAGQSEDLLRSVVGVAAMAVEGNVELDGAWFIPGDIHAGGTINAWFDLDAGSDLEEILASLVDVNVVSEDQRLWYNGLAAATLFREAYDESAPLTLLLVGGREDTEFREGSFGGRDGSPDAAPLEDGPTRSALERYYASEFERLGVQVVSVAPSAAYSEGCAIGRGRGDDELPARPPSELSFQTLPRALGGVWVDVCSLPDSGWLAHSIAGRTVSSVLETPFSNPAALLLSLSDESVVVPPSVSGSSEYGVTTTVRSSLPLVGLVWD